MISPTVWWANFFNATETQGGDVMSCVIKVDRYRIFSVIPVYGTFTLTDALFQIPGGFAHICKTTRTCDLFV